MSKEDILKSIINDINILKTIKNLKEKETIKAFIKYKLKYLEGLIKDL